MARVRLQAGRRSQIPADQQPVAGRHRQSGLRAGGGRSGGREPDRVRDLLRGEASVLHRGREHLQQLRPGRREQLLGLQPRGTDPVLLTPDRPRAAGHCERRFRRATDRDHDPRRSEAHGQDAARLEPRLLDAVTGREWATAVTGDLSAETEVEPLSNYLVGRAEKELGRRAAIGAIATAVNRDLTACASRRSAGAVLCRRRSTGYSSSTANATGSSTAGSPAASSSAAPSAITRLQNASQRYLRPARCGACRARSRRDLARRLDRQREPESQRGVHQVNAALWGVSPGFDSSDAGFTSRAIAPGCTPSISGAIPTSRGSAPRFLASPSGTPGISRRTLQGDGVHTFGQLSS